MRKILYTSLLAFFVFGNIAQAQVRKYSNEFLNLGAGAQGLARGAAMVATANDATAGYWNPAGLMFVKDKPSFCLMHEAYFAGIGKYDYASAAIPLADHKRVIGFTLLRFGVDDIPNTLFLVQPDGSINYDNVTTFSSADYAFLFSYAQNISLGGANNRIIRIGSNVKVIHRKVGHFANAWGFGIDAGAQMDINHWSFGIMAKDITTTFNAWQFNFTNKEQQVLYLTENDIPVKSTEITLPKVIGGAAYKSQINQRFSLLAELDADVTFDGKRSTLISGNTISIDPHLGLEAGYKNIIFLRAGISNIQRTLDDADTTNQRKVTVYQPSIGAGFRIHQVSIDYAFTNFANQSQPLYSNVFSIKVDLGKPENEASPGPSVSGGVVK